MKDIFKKWEERREQIENEVDSAVRIAESIKVYSEKIDSKRSDINSDDLENELKMLKIIKNAVDTSPKEVYLKYLKKYQGENYDRNK